MDRDQLMNILTMMGLSNREAEVFLAILERGEASVKDILEVVDVHQPQLYNILTNLVRRGFIKVSNSRPKLYSAYGLSSIIDSYVATLESIKEAVKNLETRRSSGSQIYVTYGTSGINNGIVEVANSAQVELYGEVPSWLLRRNIKVFMDALRRGVRLYLIVYPSIEERDADSLKSYEEYAWIRTTKLGDFLLLIADASRGIYASRRSIMGKGTPYCYIIYDRDMVSRLLTIFQSTWREAEDVIYINPEKGKYPRKFLNIFFAALTVQALLSHGYRPVIYVKGIYLKNNEPIEVRGVASSVTMINRITNIVIKSGNAQYSVGGFDAEIEDIEAREIVIESLNPG